MRGSPGVPSEELRLTEALESRGAISGSVMSQKEKLEDAERMNEGCL